MSHSNESSQTLETRVQNLEQKIDKLQTQYDRLIDYLIKPSEEKARPDNREKQIVPAVEKITPDIEKRGEGATSLLPLVAVICFVLAGVFLVKLAIDSGWLTPERQWGLLTFLGISLAGAGRFLERIENSYRTYLSASGIIILFIAAYSSAIHFEIFPQEVAVVLAMSVAFICLGLFRYHRSEIFPVLCSVGTYLSPILLGSKGELLFNSEFFIIWACLFSFLASYLKTRTLSLTAAYLGIGVFTLLYSDTVDFERLVWIIGVLVAQFFAFAFGVYFYSLRAKEAMAQREALAYLPILFFFYGTFYFFLDKIHPHLAPWLSLGFAGFIYLLYLRVKNRLRTVNSQIMVHGFLGAVFFHSGYMQILPQASKPWLLPLLLLLTFISEKKERFPKVSPILKAVFAAIGFIEFGKVCFSLTTTASLEGIVPAALTTILGLFYYLKGSRLVGNKSELFLGLLHLLSILALFRIFYDHGSFAVSMAWGAYSALILGLAFNRRDQALARSSLVVLLAASLKALIYDASQSPSGIRILSLLVTGVVLYVSGIFLKKIRGWSARAESPD